MAADFRSVLRKSCAVPRCSCRVPGKPWQPVGVVLLLILASAGCTPYRAHKTVEPGVALPATFGGPGNRLAGTPGETCQPQVQDEPTQVDRRWWTAFGEPDLDRWQTATLEGNYSLKASYARLSQSQSALKGSKGSRYPTVGVDLTGSRQRVQFGSFTPQQFDRLSLSIPVSYEIDVFGRAAAETRSARMESRAREFDVVAMALSLSAEVAEAWFSLRFVEVQRDLLRCQIDASTALQQLTQSRRLQGLANLAAVGRAENQVSSFRANTFPVEAAHTVATYQLAALSGTVPGGDPISNAKDVELGGAGLDHAGKPSPNRMDWPTLYSLPEDGLSTRVLLQRPDILALQSRILAADQQVGAAVAAWFPTFSIAGAYGFTSTESVAKLLEEAIFNLMGTVSQLVVAGGRRRAEIRRRKAKVEELMHEYTQALLNGLAEVESSLARDRQQAHLVDELRQQWQRAKRVVEDESRGFYGGASDGMAVWSAQLGACSAELNLRAAQRQHLSYRVQLHRAMGGSWITASETCQGGTP